MSETNLYQDLAERTSGTFLLGVVGPVRTGKSSFIKRFMETLVIPNMENEFARERAKDELPQSASGKTIMTAEPKFVPEEAAEIVLPDKTKLSVRLIDCVGYMVDGASGQYEDGEERMVTTPWFDHEVTITEAAEAGTEKVILDHANIGIVVTTDGSFGDIPRDCFEKAEERVITELKEVGKPFAVILNSAAPDSEKARELTAKIEEKYQISCVCLNCLSMKEEDIVCILDTVLREFPIQALSFYLPDWVEALSNDHDLKKSILHSIRSAVSGAVKIRDIAAVSERLRSEEFIEEVISGVDSPGKGEASMRIAVPRELYYLTLSRESGLTIRGDGDLIRILSSLAGLKESYEILSEALAQVRETGYSVVYPSSKQMEMEEPQIVRQNGKYGVRLRAKAPAIHLLMTDIETEVSPVIAGTGANDDIIGFLLQGLDGDVNRIWESNIFGRSLNELAEEGLRNKIDHLPEHARGKLRETMERMINEGSSGLICILL